MDRGQKLIHPRYRKLWPADWAARLIVGLLFAVAVAGVFELTHSIASSLLVGAVVSGVALGVVAML